MVGAGGSVDDAVERAREALEAGREDVALPLLVEAWRATRAPALAVVIERLGLRLAPPPERLTAAERRARENFPAAAWRALVRSGDAVRLGEALATLSTRRIPVLLGRLQLLAEAAPDPRVSGAVLPLVGDPPRGGDEGDAVCVAAIEVFLRQRDVRFVEAFRQLRARLTRSLDVARDVGGALDGAAVAVDAWTAAELSCRALAEVDRIEAALSGRAAPLRTAVPVATLFAAVYRDPAAIDARLVLADRLVDAGDPRGEFIALQCSRSPEERPQKRERELLEEHGRSWLGAIGPALSDGFEFERGFVARAALEELEIETGIGTQPEWATLTHLGLWRYEHIGTEGLLVSERLKSLVCVRDLGRTDLAALAGAAPRRWTEVGLARSRDLGMWGHEVGRAELATLPRIAPGLVRLRCPGIGADVADLRRLCSGLPALQELALGFEPARASELFEMAERAGLRSVTLLASVDITFEPAARELTISCDEDARDFYALRSRHPARRRFGADALGPVVKALPALKTLGPRKLTLRLPVRTTVRDDAVTRGAERMPIGELRDVARELGLDLQLESSRASR